MSPFVTLAFLMALDMRYVYVRVDNELISDKSYFKELINNKYDFHVNLPTGTYSIEWNDSSYSISNFDDDININQLITKCHSYIFIDLFLHSILQSFNFKSKMKADSLLLLLLELGSVYKSKEAICHIFEPSSNEVMNSIESIVTYEFIMEYKLSFRLNLFGAKMYCNWIDDEYTIVNMFIPYLTEYAKEKLFVYKLIKAV